MQFRIVKTTLGNQDIGKKLRDFMEKANLEECVFRFESKSNYAGKIKIYEYSWYEEKGHTLLGEYIYDFVIENDILELKKQNQ
jgi:hypothetical protein